MNYSLLVEPEAERDLIEIQAWYEEQRQGLAAAFLLSFEETLQRVSGSLFSEPKCMLKSVGCGFVVILTASSITSLEQ